jgi:polar amino acid transport system substrate-binding protein
MKESIPVSILYRINSGNIPLDHWIQDKDIGGGRIIGEVCHFIDLAMYLSGSLPSQIHAVAIPDPNSKWDTLSVNIQFRNGSIASIQYYANGSKELKKEYLEVFSSGMTWIIDDFKEMHVYGKSHKKQRLLNQDKGHKNEVESFLNCIRNGKDTPISFKEIYWSSRMTFDVIKSIINKKSIIY